jgi:hypothetical protein
MRLAKPLAVVLAVTLLSFAGAVSAQTKADEYSYHFDDDFMVGDTLGTTPLVIIERKPAHHVMLIRPRASFVGELLQSVETM